jgi:hypothetical protein
MNGLESLLLEESNIGRGEGYTLLVGIDLFGDSNSELIVWFS